MPASLNNVTEKVTAAPRPPIAVGIVRWFVLLALFSAAGLYSAFRGSAFQNGDIWWHLRTGLWILQTHAIPHQALFSQQTGSTWFVTSWLYDVIAGLGYKALGLKSFPLLLMAMKIALAFLTFRLARGWSGNFWGAVALSAIAQYTITGLQPTPETLSILFFTAQLAIVLRAYSTGKAGALFWMIPLLIFAWANLDIGFIFGLALVLLLLFSALLEEWFFRQGWSTQPQLSLKLVAIVSGASFLASTLNPYTVRLIPEAIHSLYSRVLFHYLENMSSLGFRRPQDFVLLVLAMTAFVILARRRPPAIFKLLLMSAALVVSLRIQRDSWVVVIAAIGVVGDFLSDVLAESSRREGASREMLCSLGSVLVLLVAAGVRVPSGEVLMRDISGKYPVAAADFIRSNRLPQPIFNAYRWGGFLTWYLPEYPVAMDSRLNLYGDNATENFFKTTAGTERLESNPEFTTAQTILLERNSGLAKALTTLPALQEQFRPAYQDEQAVILVRK